MPEPTPPNTSPVIPVEFSVSSQLCFYCEYGHKLRKYVIWWHSVISRRCRIKGGTTNEALFNRGVFCEELPLAQTFWLFHFQDLFYAQEPKQNSEGMERKKNKEMHNTISSKIKKFHVRYEDFISRWDTTELDWMVGGVVCSIFGAWPALGTKSESP